MALISHGSCNARTYATKFLSYFIETWDEILVLFYGNVGTRLLSKVNIVWKLGQSPMLQVPNS